MAWVMNLASVIVFATWLPGGILDRSRRSPGARPRMWHVSISVTLTLSGPHASRSPRVTYSANDLNSGHDDQLDETSVIRLHAAERDGEAGARCYCMFVLFLSASYF
jgi:hypothetical protein